MTHPLPPASHGDPGQPDTGERFKDRVKRWREEAIIQAVSELLAGQGCQRFTMEDVAKLVGIAKGSLYLHTNARSKLVAQALDRRLASIPKPRRPSDIPKERAWSELLDALFAQGTSGGCDLPCCLHTSPCPHGWQERWAQLVQAYGLARPSRASRDQASQELLGEAIQALAATPTVHGLLQGGQLEKAKAVLQRFVASYQEALQTQGAPLAGRPVRS